MAELPSDDEMRAEFHALGKVRAEILAKSTPLREARDRAVQAAQQAYDEATAEIKEIEKDLFDLDMRRGKLARALNGKTGEPPA